MTKRVLTDLKIGKIAAVDMPCQEGALALIMKRTEVTDRFWKDKYTAEQRREMADKGEAMKDGSYPIADADDLERAIHAVGRGKNNSHESIRAHIKTRAKALGLSDKIPEDWKGSEVGKVLSDILAKAGLTAPEAETFAEKFEDQLMLQNLWDDYWKAQSALQDSIESIIKDESVTDRPALIKQSLDEFCEYVAGLVPADITKSLTAEIAAAYAGGAGPTLKGEIMSDALKKALGLPTTATEADMLKALEKRDSEAKANECLAKMSDKHKAYMDHADAKMPKGGKEAFAGMTAAERDDHIKANPLNDDDGDENVEKMLKAGTAFRAADGNVIRKSDFKTDTAFQFAKAQAKTIADQAAAIAKRDEDDAVADFAKRATDVGFGAEFGATMRKAYSGDRAAQTEVEKRIAALQKQVEEGALFKSFGKSSPQAGSAESELLAKRDEIKKANPKLSDEQAYTKAYTDPANRDIVKRMKAEARA